MSVYVSVGRWGGLLRVAAGRGGFRLVVGWLTVGAVAVDVDAVLGAATVARQGGR